MIVTRASRLLAFSGLTHGPKADNIFLLWNYTQQATL